MGKPDKAPSTERFLSFAVAGKPFRIPAGAVQEVRRLPALVRVPNAPPSLAGLMNHHGLAIAVVCMSSLLGRASRDSGAARVIIYGEAPPVGLLVDEVMGLGAGSAGTPKAKLLDLPELLSQEFQVTHVEKVRVGFSGTRDVVPEAAAEISLIAFRIAGQRYALPLSSVDEIFALPDGVVALPRGAGSAIGMTEFRDRVLPLISLGALLGLSDTEGRRHVLVTRLGGAVAGLVAGTIDGVVRVPETAIEKVPPILQRGEGDAEIEGIARVGDGRSLISILSPDRLFRNRDIQQAIDGSNAGTATMPDHIDAELLQFVVFRLGSDTYGLPIAAVDEIVRLPEALTRLPTAPDFIAGIMNLRGKALPLIDQRRRFGSAATAMRGRVMVVSVGEVQTGFIVDSVSEILRVAASDVTPAPQMPGDGVKVFDRVAAAADGMVLIVDPKELLDRAERDVLRAFNPVNGSASAP